MAGPPVPGWRADLSGRSLLPQGARLQANSCHECAIESADARPVASRFLASLLNEKPVFDFRQARMPGDKTLPGSAREYLTNCFEGSESAWHGFCILPVAERCIMPSGR